MAVNIKWDFTCYAEKLPKRYLSPGAMALLEASLRRQYPPEGDLAAGIITSKPCIIVDKHNVIIAWYLPGILSKSRQVNLSYSIFWIYVAYLMCFRQKSWQQLKSYASCQKCQESLVGPRAGLHGVIMAFLLAQRYPLV